MVRKLKNFDKKTKIKEYENIWSKSPFSIGKIQKTNMKAESEKEELCRVSWCHQSIGAFSIIRENRNIETFI